MMGPPAQLAVPRNRSLKTFLLLSKDSPKESFATFGEYYYEDPEETKKKGKVEFL